jgi:hypothetical protein
VGYPKETLGYYFYNQSEGKVFIARNGVFLEKEFFKREKCRQKVYLEEVQDEPLEQDFTSDANVLNELRFLWQEKHHHNHEGPNGHIAQLISTIS